MAFSEERINSRVYIVVAVFIIIVVILAIFLSSNKLVSAKIQDDALGNSWIEDIAGRDSGSGFLGLEKWASFTYKNNNLTFSAYVTVTTFKTLFIMSEEELKNKMEETIKNSFAQGVSVDLESKITGERTLANGHKSLYSVYDGNYSYNQTSDKIKILGETWNCGVSGTSVICFGYAQITNNTYSNYIIDLTYWIKILKDKDETFGLDYNGTDGLLYNVKCH